MSGKDLFREIGLVKEEYITEAEEYKRSIIHNVAFQRGLAVAACLVVCGGLYWGVGYHSVSSDSTAQSTNDANNVYTEMDSATVMDNSENVAPKEENAMDMEAVAGENMGNYSEDCEESERSDGFFADGTNIQNSTTVKNEETASEPETTMKDIQCIDTSNMSGEDVAVWEAFVKTTETKTPSQIKISSELEEGTVSWTEVRYDGECFQVLWENEMGEATGFEETYLYLNQIEEEDTVQVVLSDERIETKEQLKQEEHVLHLFSYEKE